MARRFGAIAALLLTFLIGLPAAAHACGGLVAGKHAEVLRRATTLAAWFDGTEHYITGFEFAGTANTFGYIIPLPAPPTEIRKGGDWMLERLDREVFPRREFFSDQSDVAFATLGSVTVLKEVKIDSLDIRVVKGGAKDVVVWAEQHGFDMTDDTDELLARYPANIFALAKFEKANAGKKFVEGQGVVIDFEIPLAGPWIPLQILSLGKQTAEIVNAHLFMLTPEQPVLDPKPESLEGVRVAHSAPATPALIADLRSDTGTQWVPEKAWLTAVEVTAPAPTMRYDLAGVIGGISPVAIPGSDPERTGAWGWTLVAAALAALVAGMVRRRAIRTKTENV